MSALTELRHWLWLIFKKWVWAIGLVPTALSLVATYVPESPTSLPLPLNVGALALGFLVSVYLVHLDLKNKLAQYEYHEPKYDIKIKHREAKVENKEIVVRCVVQITSLNAWSGMLTAIRATNKKAPSGLSDPKITRRLVINTSDWSRHQNEHEFPFTLSSSTYEVPITIAYTVDGTAEASDNREPWKQVAVQIHFVIRYTPQPIGEVEKCKHVSFSIDLSNAVEHLLQSDNKDTQ
jgi:hypothetical protein